MKSIALIFGFVLASLLLVNCDTGTIVNASFNQKILFQAGYANYAWSPTHSGFLIDSIGNVFCYNLPSKWKDVDSLNQLSSQDMDFNLAQTDGICFTINTAELKSKLNLLLIASRAKISAPKNEGADGGVSYYFGYTFNMKTNTYKEITLKQVGDWSIENKSKAAEELATWLFDLKQQIHNLR